MSVSRTSMAALKAAKILMVASSAPVMLALFSKMKSPASVSQALIASPDNVVEIRCPGSISGSENGISFSVTCSNTQIDDVCEVDGPDGFTSQAATFTCDDSGNWIGEFPVVFRKCKNGFVCELTAKPEHSPILETSSGAPYVGAEITTNADTFTILSESSDDVQSDFTVSNNGILRGTFTEPGIQQVTLLLELESRSIIAAYQVTVLPPMTPGALRTALTLNAFFDGQTPSVTGGKPPYTFFVGEGQLPDGITLNEAGRLSGSPETLGSTTFTVSCSDAFGAVVDIDTHEFVVNEALSVTWTRVGDIPEAIIDEAYQLTAPEATAENAQGDLQFSAGGDIPTGFSVDPFTGTVFGTTACCPGTYTMEIRVTDATQVLTLVDTVNITVRRREDCELSANGPNGLACVRGTCIDDIPFDANFTCDCNSTGFLGDNCEVEESVFLGAQGNSAAGSNGTTLIVAGK